jgi:hypothetical protein
MCDWVVDQQLPQEQVQHVGTEAEAPEEGAGLQQRRDGGEHHLEDGKHVARDLRGKGKAGG